MKTEAQYWMGEYEAAEARAERLREALVAIDHQTGERWVRAIARAALDSTHPPEPGEDYPLPYQDPERGE